MFDARALTDFAKATLSKAGLPDEPAASVARGLVEADLLGHTTHGLALLARSAAHGTARLGRAACLVLATTPYLAVWYLAWAVPLAAPEDDDRAARLGALALTAYLLPQTIPR